MIEAKALSKDGNRVWDVTTAPIAEPITADEVKLFARIDGTEEDALIESFIESARTSCEKYIGRALISQTITVKMDFWPGNVIELPRPPLISITAVETLDEGDTATVYNSDNYYTVTDSTPGQLILKRSATPPINTNRDYKGFQIRYLAGYGATAASVPESIKEALKLWVTDMYENRVIRSEPPPEAAALLNLYRVMRI